MSISSSPPPRPYVDISDRSATKQIITHPSFIWEQVCFYIVLQTYELIEVLRIWSFFKSRCLQKPFVATLFIGTSSHLASMEGKKAAAPRLLNFGVWQHLRMLQDVSPHTSSYFGIYNNFFLAINKIVQSGPWVGICSAALGGHPDGPDGTSYPSPTTLCTLM